MGYRDVLSVFWLYFWLDWCERRDPIEATPVRRSREATPLERPQRSHPREATPEKGSNHREATQKHTYIFNILLKHPADYSKNLSAISLYSKLKKYKKTLKIFYSTSRLFFSYIPYIYSQQRKILKNTKHIFTYYSYYNSKTQ